jgi:hypothetical protein
MVLGFLLYEVVDLGVNIVKIGYNSTRATYYWWYSMEYPEVRALEDVERLTNRLKKVELLLKDKKN